MYVKIKNTNGKNVCMWRELKIQHFLLIFGKMLLKTVKKLSLCIIITNFIMRRALYKIIVTKLQNYKITKLRKLRKFEVKAKNEGGGLISQGTLK